MEQVEKSKMLVMFHQHPCTESDRMDMRVQFHRKDMKLLWYSHRVCCWLTLKSTQVRIVLYSAND